MQIKMGQFCVDTHKVEVTETILEVHIIWVQYFKNRCGVGVTRTRDMHHRLFLCLHSAVLNCLCVCV